MSDKLQELTDKLYNEGLSKGKKEAEELKDAAKKEAAQIVAEARAQAEKITADAKSQAEEIRTNTFNDIRMATAQTIATIRQRVEDMIVTKTIVSPVKSAMSDESFVKDIIITIAKAFNPSNSEPVGLDVIFPAEKQEEMNEFVGKQLSGVVGKGLEVSFSKYFQNGFKISPKDGGYTISFTDEDFAKILADFLRPGTKKLIFG